MAYKVIILYRLYMPPYFLGTFTEYPCWSLTRHPQGGSGVYVEPSVSKETCAGAFPAPRLTSIHPRYILSGVHGSCSRKP